MLQTIRHLLSLIRFSHTLFALPFALLAALMAWTIEAQSFGPTVSTRSPVGGDPVLYEHHYYWISPGGAPNSTGTIQLPNWLGDLLFGSPSGMPQRYAAYDAQIEFSPSFGGQLLGILICMVFARSAAMAFNRLVDRKIDAKNPRTAGRHLPAGTLSVGTVVTFTVLSSLGFVASTLLFLPNWLPLALSLPVLLWLCGYSYAKRFTSLAHYWLGAALGLSPVAAWIAIRGQEVIANPMDLLPALVLGGAVAAWVGGFDILYACQDYEYDKSVGLRSIPSRLGIRGALRLAAASHAVAVVLLALLPLVYPPFGVVYWGGVVAVAGLLIYEHALVRPENLERVNLAFFHVNAVISIGLLAVGVFDLLL
ncbi:4-hydroxybenzoate octaprenyltransferase [Botrimarina colliarenosi]|uniref:4-hydroxybenzoate polyprenyltransferase n=1 Tax=Botrimarina colliarenosi TaxID=2528001 RepID=A0A5C6ACE8_9BACT|nr:4-hydroxybenzoate octaprenyltransferase [Botrimarina colliarenosi]TWT96998.1 4-hydroxybenzoate octaprenyltransferase [Botrimarina colliarenosi]